MSTVRGAPEPAESVEPIEIGDDVHAAPGRSGAALPHRKLIFSVVSFGLLMFAIDQTIVATALQTIQLELHAGIEWAGWTITAYSLGQVVIMPLAGRVADMYGRKRVFLAAVALFTVTSLVCGLSTSIFMLVPLRALQAIGGGSIMPAATGIVAAHFGPNRDRAIGMFTSIFPIGAAVGPIIGGLFVDQGAWRGIFLINVPIGIVVLVAAAILIPRSAPGLRSRADVPGIGLFAVTLLAAMLGIAVVGEPSISFLDWRFLVPEALAVVGLLAFLRRMRTAAAPFIPLRLLAGRGFGVMNLINFLWGAAVFGFGALIPLYAQDRFSIAPLPSGTLLTARGVGMICVAALATFTMRRTGYRLPMIAGFLLTAIGLAGISFVPGDVTPYLWLSVAGAVVGLGQGIALPASNNAIMQLDPQNVGSITGLRGMFRQSGSIVAISISTAVVARSSDAGMALSTIFAVFAGILALAIPLVFLVPEHRGRW